MDETFTNFYTYADPVTGQSVDAIQAFRSRLSQLIETNGINVQIRLPFSTARTLPGTQTLFRGPVPGTTEYGQHSDKIAWLTVMLQGDYADIRAAEQNPGIVVNPDVPMSLAYRGATLLRKRQVGAYDPATDTLIDEFAVVDARTLDLSQTPPRYLTARYSSKPAKRYALGDPDLSTPSEIPPENYRIHAFNERSVATTDWELVLTLRNETDVFLQLDELYDIRVRVKPCAGSTRLP